MNILETMLAGGGGGIVNQLASQFGITPRQAAAATTTLAPALAGGVQERLSGGDVTGITDFIRGGEFTQFADNSDRLASPAALDQGKTLLSKIFGSGDTGNIVSMAAEKVGISRSTVQAILPIAATIVGGFLSKRVAEGESLTDCVGQLANAGHSGFMDAVSGLISRFRA